MRWRRVAYALCMAADSAAALSPMLLEAEVDPLLVTVNAQLVYRLRFLHAVDVQHVQLSGPQVRLAEIRQLGQVRRYEAARQGARYRVHEARYAVFPVASGPLELAGASVSGRRPGGEAIRLLASPRSVTVVPALPHDEADTPWLPARSLRVFETPTKAETRWRLGQPFERTLVIEAAGVDASVLPPLRIDGPDFHVIAGTARLSNRVEGETNIGRREQTFHVTPLVAGKRSLVDVRVAWWNVLSQRWEMVVLPGREVVVSSPLPLMPLNAPAGDPRAGASATAAGIPAWAMWLAASLPLMVVLFAVRKRAARVCRVWRARHRLAVACRTGQPQLVGAALLNWGHARWPDDPPATVGGIPLRLGRPAVGQAIADLERYLYGPPSRQASPWSGARLNDALPWDVGLGDSAEYFTDPT